MKIIVVTVFEKSAHNALKTLHMRNWQQGAIFKVTFFLAALAALHMLINVSQAIKVFIVFIFVVLIITIVIAIAIAIAKILIDTSHNDDDD